MTRTVYNAALLAGMRKRLLVAFVPFLALALVPSVAHAAMPETPSARWSIQSLAEPTSFNAADVQDNVDELVVTATEGHYKLRPRVAQGPTAPIEWDAPADKSEEVLGGPESVEKALESLPEVGAGNVAVSGGPGDASGSKPYKITWIGVFTGDSIGVLEVEEEALKDGGAGGSAVATTVRQPSTVDRIALGVVNVGSRPSEGDTTITDELPPGLVLVGEPEVVEPVSINTGLIRGKCVAAELKCTYSKRVLPGRELVMHIEVAVTSPAITGLLVNRASVSGGGGGEASTSASSPVNVGHMPFGLAAFTFEPDGVGGEPDLQAGDHPYGVTTTIVLNSALENSALGAERKAQVVQDVKDVAVELPLGFEGDPLAAPQCPEIDLTSTEGDHDTPGFRTACPTASEVGTISLVFGGGLLYNGHTVPYPVYNVVPEHGYPAS